MLQAAVKVMAKDLIRTRHQITKFYALKSQLQGVSLRIQVCQWLCYLQDEKWLIHYFDEFSYSDALLINCLSDSHVFGPCTY